MPNYYPQLIVRFWNLNPALLYGVALLLGFFASFTSSLIVLFPGLCLWLPFCYARFKHCKPLLASLTLCLAAYGYAEVNFTLPNLQEKGIVGKGHISIESVKLQKDFFGSKWIYSCQLINFFPNNHPEKSIAKHIKCTIAMPMNVFLKRPKADRDYVISGTLFKSKNGRYFIKSIPQNPWEVVDDSYNPAEMRFFWKSTVVNWIREQFSSPYSATLLGGLATGEFDDQWLRQEFSRFGLQHIMAISGFHFAIVVGVLSLLFRLLFSRKISAYVLLIGMVGYVVFLGSNPSIMRAWIMSSIVIGGYLVEKNGTALNSLGIAIIGTLLFDPLLCLSMGFQFSFLVTAAILLTYGTADEYLKCLLQKRPLSEMVEMNLLNQHGYCLLAFFRQGLALMFAVNIFAMPLTLFYFHQFPWMGLFYNLFFPLLIAAAMGLLMVGMLISWIPYVGNILNTFNNAYTNLVLKVTYQMPESMDYYWIMDDFPKEFLVVFLCLMILLSILLKENRNEDDEYPLAFI